MNLIFENMVDVFYICLDMNLVCGWRVTHNPPTGSNGGSEGAIRHTAGTTFDTGTGVFTGGPGSSNIEGC